MNLVLGCQTTVRGVVELVKRFLLEPLTYIHCEQLKSRTSWMLLYITKRSTRLLKSSCCAKRRNDKDSSRKRLLSVGTLTGEIFLWIFSRFVINMVHDS